MTDLDSVTWPLGNLIERLQAEAESARHAAETYQRLAPGCRQAALLRLRETYLARAVAALRQVLAEPA